MKENSFEERWNNDDIYAETLKSNKNDAPPAEDATRRIVA